MKYKKYPKYKDSGVEWIGEIPEGWEINKIKFYFEIKSGKTLQSSKKNEDDIQVPYITAGNVFWDKIEIDDLSMMNASSEEIKMYQIQNGDLLVSEGGDSGRSAIVDKINFDCIIQNHVHRLRPLNGSSSGYLENVLRSIKESGWFDALTKRVTMNNLPSLILANIIMPVPSEKEQYEIYNFLQKKKIQFDELIAKSKAQVTLLEEKRQATITQAITKGLDPSVPMKDSGVEWIGEIPEGWEVKKLKFVANFDNSTVDRHVYDDEIPVSISHYPQVYNNETISLKTELPKGTCSQKEFENFRLKKNDVLITKDSETADDIGVPVYILDDFSGAVCGYHIAQISTDKNQLFGGFLFRFIQSSNVNAYFETEANGVTRYGLGKDSISNLIVPLPPKLVQEQIYDFLQKQTTQFDELIAKSKAQVTLLEEKRQALITATVTGKIDVRSEVVA